jgi:L,D-transpeptidase ErfK/SrfK
VRAGVAAASVMLLAVGLASQADASLYLPLGPGSVTGNVNPYEVKRRDSLSAIALRFTINPVRITKLNWKSMRDGLDAGEVLAVDQRRIKPRFDASVTGIVLNLPEAQVYYVENGEIIKDYPVAVSAPNSPTWLGATRVVSMEKNPTWHVPASIQAENARAGRTVRKSVPPGPWNPLGSRWIGFWDGSFGFHGTNTPTSIKQYASHGCVRFLAHDIQDLYTRVGVGTPVQVLYQPVLLAVDRDTVWMSAYPDIYRKRFNYKAAVATLANWAGVGDRINWKAVTTAAREQDGMLVDIGLVPGRTPWTPPKAETFRKLRPSEKPAPKPTPDEEMPDYDNTELMAPPPRDAEPLLYKAPATPKPRPTAAEPLLDRDPSPWYTDTEDE